MIIPPDGRGLGRDGRDLFQVPVWLWDVCAPCVCPGAVRIRAPTGSRALWLVNRGRHRRDFLCVGVDQDPVVAGIVFGVKGVRVDPFDWEEYLIGVARQ